MIPRHFLNRDKLHGKYGDPGMASATEALAKKGVDNKLFGITEESSK